MTLGPAPDWQRISWMVGNYNGEPILVTVDGLGRLTGGLIAYDDRYLYRKSGTSVGADVTVETEVVPAGEVWVITNIAGWHTDPISRVAEATIHITGDYHYLFANRFLLQYEYLERQGVWVLKEGDSIAITFYSLASGKIGYVDVAGYKIQVE